MIVSESWNLALEALSTVPFTFGFVPTNSVVVLSLDAEERSVSLGPCGRIDLAAVYAARDAGEFGAMVEVTGPVARGGARGGLVAVWAEAENQEAASELLELVAGMLAAEWPFEEHWGTFLVTSDGVLGLTAAGDLMGWKDALELQITRFAMSRDACALAEGSSSLRVPRSDDPAAARDVLAARTELAGERIVGKLALQLTQELVQALDSGEPDLRAQGRLGLALQDVWFRDALLAWVLAGAPEVVDIMGIPVVPWLEASQLRPPRPSVQSAIALLGAIARHQPPGNAAPPLACAAYLAWFAGQGALPRELMEQALEEDPTYSLAHLVEDALAASVPPPWVALRAAAA
nr:DUF4192 family protein [Actinomycetales bacterium]